MADKVFDFIVGSPTSEEIDAFIKKHGLEGDLEFAKLCFAYMLQIDKSPDYKINVLRGGKFNIMVGKGVGLE